MVKFSIIVITYNRPHLLCKCLNSLSRQESPKSDYEVIIVDDGSGPETKESVKAFSPKMNLVYLKEAHGGISLARNTGISKARGSIIAFVDDDCLVEKDYVQRVIDVHQNFPQAKVIAFRIVNAEKDNLYGVMWEFFLYRFLKPEIRKNTGIDLPCIGILGSGISSFKKEIFDSCGLFDKSINFNEDGDLQCRIEKSGEYIFYQPQVVIKHFYVNNFINFIKKGFYNGRQHYYYKKQYKIFPDMKHRVRFVSLSNLLAAVKNFGLVKGLVIFFLRVIMSLVFTLGILFESFVPACCKLKP